MSERQRYILLQTNILNRMDNLFFQHQNSFLDKEYYEDVVELICRNNASVWKYLEIPMRRSFRAEGFASVGCRDVRTSIVRRYEGVARPKNSQHEDLV